MNAIINEQYPLFQLYQALRAQLMTILSDEDLALNPGGNNLTLGLLCREMGEIEQCYITSFETFRQDFSYRNSDPELEHSVDRLTAWYDELDKKLRAAVESLTDEDIHNRLIDRGPDFKIPPNIQLEIYKEALLIFYGKAGVYLKILGKTPGEQWQNWIA